MYAGPFTEYLRQPSVRLCWKSCLRHTSVCVAETNRKFKRPLIIPPSKWVRDRQRYGCVGTAYDYVVGAIWARKGLDSPLGRARLVLSENTHSLKMCRFLEQLLSESMKDAQEGRLDSIHSDFFRGLGALADIDAVYRASVALPDWMCSRVRNLKDLRSQFYEYYPDEFVAELKSLYAVTIEDLPRANRIVYNPVFGGSIGQREPQKETKSIILGADGDLLLDQTLLELKVSVHHFTCDNFWQLLGYAAMDHTRGKRRIKNVGIYNPRFRVYWCESLNELTKRMGNLTFEDFCRWFQDNAASM